METVKISFDITTSDTECPFGIEILLDNVVVYKIDKVQEKIAFEYDINDDDSNSERELQIVLNGKTSNHTKVDKDGNIIKDVTLAISNFIVDDIDVNQLFLEKCVYTHDFNGTQSAIADSFHGIAGCNGIISLKFSTPLYLWLLENM